MKIIKKHKKIILNKKIKIRGNMVISHFQTYPKHGSARDSNFFQNVYF